MDDAAFIQMFGPLIAARKGPGNSAGGLSIARCERQYGKPGARIPVLIEIEVTQVGSMDRAYDGLRRAGQRSGDVQTDVPGLGQGAYSWSDELTGPHLATYDGNLYLTLTILSSRVSRGGGVTDAMITTTRSIMTKLRLN